MTKVKVKASRLADMYHYKEGYKSAYAFLKTSCSEKMEDGEIVVRDVVLLRIIKEQGEIELLLDPEQELELDVRENNFAKEPYLSECKIKQKLSEAKLQADLYATSEDGIDSFKTLAGPRDTEKWEKSKKHWEMLDEIEEIKDKFFDFQKEQSKSIPMDYHQAAFELKKMIVQKIKEMGLEGWQENEKFKEALQYQGVQMNDTYERNWCSSSADCRHLMHPHEDITDKLK